ncbi:MAG: phytanoyl-CoA dioxygenase family protein [Candidatus Latescibacterota bacterium]|nr:phytanoyl-CoA dioxygenase family protein [Candidatus Latescibacterota bacterium]
MTIAQTFGLTPQEHHTYRNQGLVRPAYRLPGENVARLRDLVDRTLESTVGQPPESIVCPYLPGWNGLPDDITSQWLDVAGTPEIVDYVVSVLGPDVILWGGQLFCKPAAKGLEVPWHQDGQYWPIRPLATCSVWVAIDDVTTENGCMRYIPGSHRKAELFPHVHDEREDLVLNQVTDAAHFDEATARDDELGAGELSLHDVYLIHGSQPNRSARRRAGFVLRFMPSSSLFDRQVETGSGSAHFNTNFATRPIFLMRGDAGANTEVISRHPRYA